MAHERATPIAELRLWQKPWPVLLTGMGLVAVAAVIHHVAAGGLPQVRLLLLGGGLIAAAQAVILRMRQGSEQVEERVESAAVITLAGFTALIGLLATDKDWDSADMVLKALLVVAGIGLVLVLLDSLWRRIAISALVLFHFAGVFVTITMIPPPGHPEATAPFLAVQAWIHVYRPYLQFLYMNNAYHFYSPEPGPPTQLWFSLNYESTDEKGAKSISTQWVKLPDRKTSPVNLHYQRLLSITESCNIVNTSMPADVVGRMTQHRDAALLAGWTDRAGAVHSFNLPYRPSDSATFDYQPAQDHSAIMMAAIIRRIARLNPTNPEAPTAKLVSIKFYRVQHWILPAKEMGDGYLPTDETLYHAYYQGEFFTDGRLVNLRDPFLYWRIPIIYEGNQIRHCVREHAGLDYNWADRDRVLNEKEKQP